MKYLIHSFYLLYGTMCKTLKWWCKKVLKIENVEGETVLILINYQQVYYKRLPPSPHLIALSSKECFFLPSVTLNGIIFSKELWLPKMMEDKHRICEVIDIFSTDLKDVAKIWVVCKVYVDVTFEPHYNCHIVQIASLQEELEIINIKEYLSEHEYPVKIHIIENKRLFRCKRF